MIPHARAICFGLGVVCGSLALAAVVVVALAWAQGSLSGQNLRHYKAAERETK